MNTVEYKVLPFELADGTKVPGHAIQAWNEIQYVVFWTFDTEADMSIETVIPIQNWTKFMHRTPLKAHSLQAVILRDGTRIRTTTLRCSFNDDGWNKAPVLARNAHTVARLGDRTPLATIVGVTAWYWSKDKDESLILNPWERDNAAYRARFPKLAAMA